MALRAKAVLAAAAACWVAVACRGGEPTPARVASIDVGGVRVDVWPDGRFSVRRGDRVLIRNTHLVLAGEGWRGSAGQSAMKAAAGFPRRDGEAHVFRGTVVEPVAGAMWTLDQRIEPVEGGVRILYAATPERDCEISEACVFMDLPVAEWSEKPVVLWPLAERVFPAQAPERRHFLSGATRRAALGAAGPERLGLAFDTAVLCTVQDCRASGSDCYHGGWVSEDPDGILVHNGLWGPLMSGSAGTGMPWGWGDWIDRQDMYRYWKPVAALVAGVPFAHREWRPLRVEKFTFREKGRAPYYAGVFVEGWPRNYGFTLCPSERPEVFEIDAEGELRDEDSMSAVLRGGERLTLSATFPVDGALVVHVPEISESGAPASRVDIDGRPALTEPLPRGEGKPWAYWRSFPVPVSAGVHRIAISNSGSGALWTAFELQRFRRRDGPDLDVAGQSCDDTLLLWLRNPQFIWLCRREGRQPTAQPRGMLTLGGIADGSYAVTWIETTTGETLATGAAESRAGRMTLPTPPVTRSAAAKLVRNPSAP